MGAKQTKTRPKTQALQSVNMETKRTSARITERFIWPGVATDVHDLISTYWSHCNIYYNYVYISTHIHHFT